MQISVQSSDKTGCQICLFYKESMGISPKSRGKIPECPLNISVPRLALASNQQTQEEYVPAFSEKPPHWDVLLSYFLNSYFTNVMCYSSQDQSEDNCQLLCGGWSRGENQKLGTQGILPTLVQHYMGSCESSLEGARKIISLL